MRDFTKHALALFAAPAVAPADSGALAPRTSVIAALVVARPHEAIVHPPIPANNRTHVVPTRDAQASDAPARRTSTLAALLLTGVANPGARAPDAPTRRTSAIAAMLVAPPRDHALSRSFPPKDERASAAPDATAETALIVALLRDRARELPTTTTGVKSASILRACAVTIESRPATPTQTALEARGMAVAHLQSVAAKTSGKLGEAIFLAAKAIETGRHRAEPRSKDNGAASPVSAPSVHALSAATQSSSTSRPEKLAPVTAHGHGSVQTGHGAGPSSRARLLTETPSPSTPAATIDSLAALKRLSLIHI